MSGRLRFFVYFYEENENVLHKLSSVTTSSPQGHLTSAGTLRFLACVKNLHSKNAIPSSWLQLQVYITWKLGPGDWGCLIFVRQGINSVREKLTVSQHRHLELALACVPV